MTSRPRVVTVVGARPQFIKAAPMSAALGRAGFDEFLLHTGQHYDAKMSQVFFDELGIPAPDLNLHVGSGAHGEQTARMLIGIERALLDQRPGAVIVYGDTNSTVAAALAAAKLSIPIAHVEAGLRSFDRSMPEEINRVVTDHVSTLLWAPGAQAVANLRAEGITDGVEIVGDVMVDALELALARGLPDDAVARAGVVSGQYLFMTLHRAENTNAEALVRVVAALSTVAEPVIWPVHPRTRAEIAALGAAMPPHVKCVEPLGRMETLALARHARLVLTDSGGLQKEAYWLGVPCVTLRTATEWVETVAAGWNVLVGTDTARIEQAIRNFAPPAERPHLYGDGRASDRCVASLERSMQRNSRDSNS